MPATTDQKSPIETDTPQLDERQREQVERRMFIPALVVHEVVRKQGDEELERPVSALAWSGLAAGMSMGLSLVAEGLIRVRLPNASWTPLVVRFGYSLGFLLVIIGRQQLFTENTLTPILPLMARRNRATLGKVLRLWTTVLIANLVGAHLVAWALAATPVFEPQIRHAFLVIARQAVDVGFGEAILRGIFAGWLIAMMVWMLAAVRTGQIAIIVILTYIVGLGEFTHIIAGSVEALFLVWSGRLSWFACVGGYMVPTLIGNVIGGVSLVAAVNHAQVVSGAVESAASRDRT
jgi:formate/nitrite transporter FocA (FNT family)